MSKHFEILKPTHCADKRACIFCQVAGDQEANAASRLLVVDVDKWVHLNCALWSDEVYETMNGALVNVDVAFRKSVNVECCFCHQKGASLKCFSNKCASNYHFVCAVKDKCAFNQDKVSLLFGSFSYWLKRKKVHIKTGFLKIFALRSYFFAIF